MGSTFIAIDSDSAELLESFDIETLELINHIQLDELMTLDFCEALLGSGLSWSVEEPVLYNEADGITIFEVNIGAIEYVISQTPNPASVSQQDVEKLKIFMESKSLSSRVFELSTF